MYLDERFLGRFPYFVQFLEQNSLLNATAKNIKILACLKKQGEQDSKYFRQALIVGNKPRIVPKELQGKDGNTNNNSSETRAVEINISLLYGHQWSKVCENYYFRLPTNHPIRKKLPNPVFTAKVWEERITATLFHELVHFANHDKLIFPDESDERGFKFENCAGLNTPTIPDSEIEDFSFWASFSTIENSVFPLMQRI